jgi:hypothetical protein
VSTTRSISWRRLFSRCAVPTAEVLRRDDVRGVDAPLGGELHAALLEVDRAVTPVRHDDVAALPGHLVVGVHTGGGEDPLDLQALAARRLRAAPRAGAGQAIVGLGHRVELSLVVSCIAVWCSVREVVPRGGSEGWGRAGDRCCSVRV